jgi:hypothetical protein
MDVIFVEEHDPHVNPLGLKGVGEIAIGWSRPGDRKRSLSRDRNTYPRVAYHGRQAALKRTSRPRELKSG